MEVVIKCNWCINAHPSTVLFNPGSEVLLQVLSSESHDPVHGVKVQGLEPAGDLKGQGDLLMFAPALKIFWYHTIDEGCGQFVKEVVRQSTLQVSYKLMVLLNLRRQR